MRETPALERHVDIGQVLCVIRLAVFCARRDLCIHPPLDEAIFFQFTKLQRQSALRDSMEFALQFAKAAHSGNAQVPKDQNLPFAAQHIHCLVDEPRI